MKGNMAYEDRKIRANTMGTQTVGIEDKKTLLHNFKMYTNVTTLKRDTNSPENSTGNKVVNKSKNLTT